MKKNRAGTTNRKPARLRFCSRESLSSRNIRTGIGSRERTIMRQSTATQCWLLSWHRPQRYHPCRVPNRGEAVEEARALLGKLLRRRGISPGSLQSSPARDSGHRREGILLPRSPGCGTLRSCTVETGKTALVRSVIASPTLFGSYEYRDGVHLENAGRGGDESVGRHDHLVSGAYSERLHDKFERVGSVRCGDPVSTAVVLGEGRLKPALRVTGPRPPSG